MTATVPRFGPTPGEGLLVIGPEDHWSADLIARRLLDLEDDGDIPADIRRQVGQAITSGPELPFEAEIELELAHGPPERMVLDARQLGAATAVLLRRRASRDRRIGREGAIALALSQLHHHTIHELRGPLNSTSLNLALLGRAARGDLAELDNSQERQEGWIQAIGEELERLTALVERWSNILTVGEESPQRLDLRGTLGELDMTLSPLAKNLAVELEIHRPEEGICIKAPVLELSRLLTSLTAASMEALDSGERLRLELSAKKEMATIEAVIESDSEEGPSAPEGASLVSTLTAELAIYCDDLGGRLQPAGRAGWSFSWPLASCEHEETAEDA